MSAKLNCIGGAVEESGPAFNANVGLELVYQQTSGDPMDISEFTSHHASLARQIYPMLAQELRGLLTRMGLSNIQLPFDLTPRSKNINVSAEEIRGRVH